MMLVLWASAVWAVVSAPTAAAAGMSSTLSWTGLHDSYGVPVGAYFVSVVPMAEAVRAQGPDFDADPDSWGPALRSSVSTMMTYTQLSAWLAVQCAVLIVVAAVGIWFVKFALSAQWLGWLAALAAPLISGIGSLTDRLYVMPLALLGCCLVGGVTALTRGVGRGMGIIVGGFAVILGSAVVLRDPVGELVGEHGLLGIGRSLGFAVAQGGLHNGPIATGGTAAQLDVLGSWLCDVLLRQQIQLINFGMVVDDAGCGQLWSAAIMSGQPGAPAHAVAGCAPAALAHAQQLDTSTVGLFAMVIGAVGVVTLALAYIGCEVFRIGFTAFLHLLVIIPAAAVAVAPGPPRRFAARIATRLVVHGVEMLVATAGLGIVVMLMGSLTRGAAPGVIGVVHPMAKLVLMCLVAVAAALGFRRLLRGFGDRGLPGPVTVLSGGARAVTATGNTARSVDYTTRRARELRTDTGTKTSTGSGVSGVTPPVGRSAHPSPSPTQPLTTPHQRSAAPITQVGLPPSPAAPGPGRGTHPPTPAHRALGQAATVVAPEAAAGAAAVRLAAASLPPVGAGSRPATEGDGGPARRGGSAPPPAVSPAATRASTASTAAVPAPQGRTDPPGRSAPIPELDERIR